MASPVLKAIAETINVSQVGEFDTIYSQVGKLSPNEIIDFLQLVQSNLPRARKSNSYFSYAANSELSGYPTGYPSFNSRAANLKQACYFAACYADQLVLLDPFSRVLKGIQVERIDSDFIYEFSFFISILIMMDPLLENGIITFSHAVGENVCPDCFYKLLNASDDKIPNVELIKSSNEALTNEAHIRLVSIDSSNQECIARIEGPSDIFGDEPKEIVFKKQGRILTKKDIGKFISPKKINSLGILYSYSRYSIQDASSKARIYQKYGINRNFASSSEISLLKRAFGETQLVSSNFESDAPILMADSLGDLISLRENEWHLARGCRHR